MFLGDRVRRSSFAILLTLPDVVQASGGDVLGLLWAQAGLFLLVAASLFVVRLSSAQKTVVFFAYLASGIAASYATLDLPYSANAFLIDSVSISVPLLVWIVVLGYFIKRRGKKHNQPLHPILGSGAPRRPSDG
jgi:ABC-type polysaccharide/polyol phosphate export permease